MAFATSYIRFHLPLVQQYQEIFWKTSTLDDTSLQG